MAGHVVFDVVRFFVSFFVSSLLILIWIGWLAAFDIAHGQYKGRSIIYVLGGILICILLGLVSYIGLGKLFYEWEANRPFRQETEMKK